MADLIARDKEGYTPFFSAIALNQGEIAKFLLEKSAVEPVLKDEKTIAMIDQFMNSDTTAIHFKQPSEPFGSVMKDFALIQSSERRGGGRAGRDGVRRAGRLRGLVAALGIPAPQQNAMLRAAKRAFWLRSTSGDFFVRAGLGCFIWVFLLALLAARRFFAFNDTVRANPQLPGCLNAIQWAARKNARKQRDELLAALRNPSPVASGLAASESARSITEEKERGTAAESETAMMLAPPAPIRRTRRI